MDTEPDRYSSMKSAVQAQSQHSGIVVIQVSALMTVVMLKMLGSAVHKMKMLSSAMDNMKFCNYLLYNLTPYFIQIKCTIGFDLLSDVTA